MALKRKLAILADAAKYDASCASSGSKQRRSRDGKGIGSTEGMGICHSYTPDGRCVSLLKILLTNYCIYDCLYCINRRSSGVERSRFSVDDVVRLTIAFYRRNYIEGLFLSSGIARSPDDTMEQLVRVARTLRVEHDFHGYIHLKTIPNASSDLIAEAGRWADRLSVNVELPTQDALDRLAPEKELVTIRRAMGEIKEHIAESASVTMSATHAPTYAPAGQSTQLVVGASDATDATILGAASTLYAEQRLRRVYYSAFSPIPSSSDLLPVKAPPLVREHRLYQADWLMRFYGFAASELTTRDAPNLALDVDPKLAWAIAHRADFPVDVNAAPREMLLRVPGLGARNVARLLEARRWRAIRWDDLVRLRVGVRRAAPFLVTADRAPSATALDSLSLRARLTRGDAQLDMFVARRSATTGDL